MSNGLQFVSNLPSSAPGMASGWVNHESFSHSSEHTHTVNTHPEQWAANAAAPGEQLGVRCLAQGSHLSRGIEGGESAGRSLPPPTIPAGPEIRTRNLGLQVQRSIH